MSEDKMKEAIEAVDSIVKKNPDWTKTKVFKHLGMTAGAQTRYYQARRTLMGPSRKSPATTLKRPSRAKQATPKVIDVPYRAPTKAVVIICDVQDLKTTLANLA